MLIPDLLNILFDQTNYHVLVIMKSLNKRGTKYANKYSVLSHYGGHIEVVRFANVNDALTSNAKAGNILIVKYLVDIGANVHACVWALCYSAEYGHLGTVKYLANVVGTNIHSFDDYALRWSAQYGHLDVVKYLVSIGADIHAMDDLALQKSADGGFFEVVKFLVSVGANIHAKHNHALWLSANKGHLEVVKYLVAMGANIHDYDVLRFSAYGGNLEVVKYLVSVGANINVNNNELFELKIINDNFCHLK